MNSIMARKGLVPRNTGRSQTRSVHTRVRREHRDCQDGRHDSCEGDIEIFTHRWLLSAQHPRHKPTFEILHIVIGICLNNLNYTFLYTS